MSNENKLINSISLYRLLAMILVVFGHLVSVATYSYEIPDVLKSPLESPILPENTLASIDGSFATYVHTNAGSLGVVMFFIASGYLVSKMLDRYNWREFLVNRCFSIFPTLWISLLVVALFVHVFQGIVYSPADIWGSMFPIWPRISGKFITLVLWTLRIELKFYLFVVIFRKNRKNIIIYGYLLVFLAAIIYHEFRSPWVYIQMYDISFMCFPILGVVIEYVQRTKNLNGLKYISACVLVNLLLFKVSIWIFQEDRGFYPACATQIIPVVLFLLLMKLEEVAPKLYQFVPQCVYAFSKLSMPVYCTHVGCGLTVMYQLSKAGYGFGVTLIGGFLTALIVGGVVYLLVTKPSTILMKKAIAAMRKQS